MTKFLWDLSNYDWGRHTVNLADARRAGISGVTHKATEGGGYQDPFLGRFGAQAKSAGFPVVGTYHVLHSGNINGQANYWFNYVNQSMPWWRDHPCFIWQVDAERWPDGYPTATEVDAFADVMQAKTRAHVFQVPVYGPGWVYGDKLRVTDKPLWQSNYGNNPIGNFRAVYPGDRSSGWNAYSGHTPIILQFGSRGIIGKQRTCDINAVRVSTEAQLQALFLTGKPNGKDEFDMTPAERASLISDIANAVWSKQVQDPRTKKPHTTAAYLVYSNIHASAASTAAAAAQKAVAALGTAVHVAFDAKAAAGSVLTEFRNKLGGIQ